MDHINDILNSDLLQRYALGEVTPQEKMKVELLLIDQPEIRAALRNIEINIEQEAIKGAVTPPHANREAIIRQMKGTNIPSHQSHSTSSAWKLWSSMAAALLIGVLATGLFYNSKNRALTAQLASSEAELIKVQTDCDRLSDLYAFLNDGETKPYLLSGNAFEKDAEVVIYWNEQLEKSMLRVMTLPAINK